MTDTLVLCGSSARPRAAELTDALSAAGLDPALVVLDEQAARDPALPGLVRAARCVVLCWSLSTGGGTDDGTDPGSEAFATLAALADRAGNFVHVRIDRGAGPPGLIYDYIAYPGEPLRRWWASLFDSLYTRDIIAAVRNRRARIYPPEPIARTRMVRRQAAMAIVGLGGIGATISGVLGLGQFIPWPRWQEEAAWKRVPDGDCSAMADFAREWPDGRHGATARAIVARPQQREHALERVRPLVIAGPLASGKGHPTRDQAERAAIEWARARASAGCAMTAGTLEAKLEGWSLSSGTPACEASRTGWFCQVDQRADCRTREVQMVDFCAKALPSRLP